MTCVFLVITTWLLVVVQIYCTRMHPLVSHGIIFNTHFMVSSVSRHPHMLMDYGTIGMTSCFPPLGFLVLSTSINHSLRYLPNMFKCIINVSITTHVGGSWHTGHGIMSSPHSVVYNRCIPIKCQLWSCIQLTTIRQSTWWPNNLPELVFNMTCTVS